MKIKNIHSNCWRYISNAAKKCVSWIVVGERVPGCICTVLIPHMIVPLKNYTCKIVCKKKKFTAYQKVKKNYTAAKRRKMGNTAVSSFISAEHGNEVVQKNAFFYLWIISALISTCYTFTWDIKMDWGLLDKNAGENKFLREEIVYAYKVKCIDKELIQISRIATQTIYDCFLVSTGVLLFCNGRRFYSTICLVHHSYHWWRWSFTWWNT